MCLLVFFFLHMMQAQVSALQCPLGLNLPLVLVVHGGPWSRDTWGADPLIQLLTNRGYAVLQVGAVLIYMIT
jgi:hypothetical protein